MGSHTTSARRLELGKITPGIVANVAGNAGFFQAQSLLVVVVISIRTHVSKTEKWELRFYLARLIGWLEYGNRGIGISASSRETSFGATFCAVIKTSQPAVLN